MCELFKPQAMEWFPEHIFSGEESLVLLILNQPLQKECEVFLKKIWKSALFRVAVDGGANVLKELSGEEITFIPELVCGDFDSATPEVLNFYRSQGVAVIETPDQDETDFTKALRLTEKYLKDLKLKASSVIAVARNGDRLDHILGNLNTLYSAIDVISVPVLILGHNSLTWLLSIGHHKIHVSERMVDSHVGLIPLGSECKATTTGLKWNLNNDKMKFGGLISTCNMFDGSKVVTVTTDSPLVWTMEVTMDKN